MGVGLWRMGRDCVVYGALAGRLTAERRGSEDVCGALQMDAEAVPLSAGNAGAAACGLVATHRKPFVPHMPALPRPVVVEMKKA